MEAKYTGKIEFKSRGDRGMAHLVPQEVPVEDVLDRPREHLPFEVAESQLAVFHLPRPVFLRSIPWPLLSRAPLESFRKR